ncbi:FHA domain-containing protein [Streptomyces sp. NPDC007983]|uniref:FHA domain-containing protein n=1 Tax=Streptomyces sp. NPDC007983 TaxID=3364800 RepID=UPI0036F0CECF
MQIRLTVLGPRSAHPGRSGHPAPTPPPHALAGAVDVLVTAPVGTALASVTSGLAAAVAAAGHDAGGGTGAVVVYAGSERLDPQRCALGEPPLVDGAVLSLHAPADPDHYPGYPGYPGLPEAAVSDATVHLDVIAGPDAGGVHLLHGGQVRIGRSADADVPLDDPDVSRLHCAVTVTEDGRVTIADLGSTNGTAADGAPVGRDPVPLPPGALLRIGESALRLRAPAAAPSSPVRLPVHPDGEGHLRVAPRTDGVAHAQGPWTGAPAPRHPGRGWAPAGQWDATTPAGPQGITPHPGAPTTHGTGTSPGAPAADTGPHAERPAAPGHPAAQAPWAEGPAGGSAPYGDPAGSGFPGQPGGIPGQPGAAGNPPYGSRVPGAAGQPGPRPGGPGGGAPYDDPAATGPRGATNGPPADARGAAGRPGAGGNAAHGDPTGSGLPGQPGAAGNAPYGGRTHGGRSAAPAHDAQEPRPGDARTSGGRPPASPAPWTGGAAGGSAPYGDPTAPGPYGTADRRPSDDRDPAGRPGGGSGAPHGTPTGSSRPPGVAGRPGPGAGGPGGGAPYDDQTHPGPHSPATDQRPGAGGGAAYDTPTGTSRAPGGPHGAQEPWAGDSRTGQGRHPASPGPRAGGPAGGAPYDDPAATGPRAATDGPPADARGLPGQRSAAAGGNAPYGSSRSSGAPRGPQEPWPGGADRLGAAGGSGRGDQEPWAPGPAEGSAPHGAGDRRPGGRGRGTPLRGTTVPQGLGEAGAYAYDAPGAQVRRRGIGAWVRQLTGGRGAEERGADEAASAEDVAARAAEEAAALHRRWPDPAAVLMTALGPGPRLWERGPGHPDALTVRLGSADRLSGAGGLLPAAPVTVDLRQAGSLGLAGPRGRLAGLARSVVAQLAALHPPGTLEIVLLSTEDRPAEWSWLGWLPQVQPLRGQDCRLLLAYDAEQVTARTAELTRRLDDAAGGPAGPYTVVIVDGDPGPPALRETLGRLAVGGPGAGIHLLCLAEAPAASPASPLSVSYETACAASPAFASCEVAALLSGDVATGLQIVRRDAATGGAGVPMWVAGATTAATVDAVSGAWAERFARALAPLRPAASGHGDEGGPGRQVSAPLPDSARLLDELGLARATPASLMARWAAAADEVPAGGRALAVLGAGPRGPVTVDLAADGPHLLIDGGAGTGKTELLRSLAASLAAAERPDRLELVLLDGAGASGGAERGEGLRMCTDLPHVSTYLAASDPVRMREFAQALSSELKRRAELLGRLDFVTWHTRLREGTGASAAGGASPRVIAPRSPGDVDAPPSTTLRLRPQRGRHDQPDRPDPSEQHDPGARTAEAPRPFPRLVVLVDDFDALVAPALGSPGRPAAGSVVRALEAIARDGAHLGVHLVAASGRPDRTADTAAVERAGLRIVLEPRPLGPASSERPEAETHASDASGEPGGEHAPGRGRLLRPEDAATTPFQAGRVTGRIPRTATQRPTVVPLEWERMGDPPARRPLRELGNGPTDLALLASALQRAAQSADAPTAPALI